MALIRLTAILLHLLTSSVAIRQRRQRRWSDISSDSTQTGVVYGVMTTNLPAYTEKVRAQTATWASGLPAANRYFAVSGTGEQFGHHVPSQLLEGVQVSDCNDYYLGVTCKEERILEGGFARKAEWLVVLGEDNYVDTKKLEAALADLTTDKPKAVGLLSCGFLDGTCPEATGQHSFCGGGGYMLNRAALANLMSEGQNALRSEYERMRGHQGDLTTSCALRKRGIEMVGLRGLIGDRVEQESVWKKLVNSAPLTYHYVTPNIMHWIYAVREGRPTSEVIPKERAAFVGGCCCWFKDKDKDECQAQVSASDNALALLSTAHKTMTLRGNHEAELLWKELELSYVAKYYDEGVRLQPSQSA